MVPNFRQTILVVGAGAHVPYEMPTSKQLTKSIKDLGRYGGAVDSFNNRPMSHYPHGNVMKDKAIICRLLRDLQIVPDPRGASSNSYPIKINTVLDKFITAFSESRMYSIDAFLAKYSERTLDGVVDEDIKLFPAVGKLLISFFIKKHEEIPPVGYLEFDWIDHIINHFLKSPENMKEFFNQGPRIYTFNYDNLLENLLIKHLITFHNFSISDAEKQVEKLNITHIYGKIGGPLNGASSKDKAAHESSLEDIRVIGEERSKDQLDAISKSFGNALENTTWVYFLGFGFDPLNSGLLFRNVRKDYLPSDLKFNSTNVGLSQFDINEIRKHVPVNIHFHLNKEEGQEVDSLLLIREKAPIFQPPKLIRKPLSHRPSGGGWMGS